MKYVKKIEDWAEDLHKKLPHLPKSAQTWLAQNIWWIAIVGAGLSAISVIASLQFIATLSSPTAFYGYPLVGVTHTGYAITTALISLAFVVVTGLLLALAVKPLRAQSRKGWTLLFYALLVEAVSVVVNAIVNFNIFGFFFQIIFGAVFVAITAYFIFEIRSHFLRTIRTKAAAKK